MADKYNFDNNDSLDAHSRKKLEFLKSYLRDYFLTVCKNPRIDRFSFVYVNGFSGGGLYKNNELGSPLVAMDVIEKVIDEINDKKHKTIKFDIKYIFIDINKDAIESLKKNINATGFDKNNIKYFNTEFNQALPSIIGEIKTFSNSEYCIFFLDPYGYTDINKQAINEIAKLKKSEIMLTLMTDHALHYFTDKNNHFENTLKKLGFPADQVEIFKQEIKICRRENSDSGIERNLLCKLYNDNSGFAYNTDFSLQQIVNNKYYTIIHYSKHITAREVSLKQHWDKGDDTRVGFYNGITYTNHVKDAPPLFCFEEIHKTDMKAKAHKTIYDLLDYETHTLIDIHNRIAKQRSAMLHAHLLEVMQEGIADKSFIAYNKEGNITRDKNKIVKVRRHPQIKLF